MKATLKRWLTTSKELLWQTVQDASGHDLPLHGAAIAFYTIFSVAPFFLIILSLSQFLLSEELVRQELYEMMVEFIGSEMAGSIQKLIETYGSSPGSVFAYVIGIGTILFGATTVITQLKTSLNTIWEAEEPKRHLVFQYLIDRLVSFGIIIITTALFILVLFVEALTPVVTDFFDLIVPDFLNPVLSFGLPLSSFLLALLVFYTLFRILPDVRIPRKDIFIGALITAILFWVGKFLVGLYLSNASVQVAYRAAGSFVVFLIWTYYNVQIILLGAEFTRVYSQKRRSQK